MTTYRVSTVEGQAFDMTYDATEASHGVSVRWEPVGEWYPVPLQSGAYRTARRAARAVLEYTDGEDVTDRVASVEEVMDE